MYDILREQINRRTFIERTTLTVAGIVMTPAVLAGCGGSTSTSGESLLDQARKAGYIRVGFANEAPYGYADSSGKLTGEAPTVAGAIMKKLGVPSLQGVLTEFGALIPGLTANRFDIIAAGMFITPQRCNAILFSNPDYLATEALAVKAGNPHNLNDYQSLANSQAVVGAESGAVEGPRSRRATRITSPIIRAWLPIPTLSWEPKVGRWKAPGCSNPACPLPGSSTFPMAQPASRHWLLAASTLLRLPPSRWST